MLPSTGYFKGINCPFYDSGSCERPYCHFRHVRKDSSSSSTQSDGFESGAMLQKLVSAAVQKVLQQSETSTVGLNNQVARIEDEVCNVNNAQSKATYNPTPIAELNKINNSETENSEEGIEQRRRHIPVPYTPRKPTSVPIKRPFESNGSPQSFIYLPPAAKYTPGSAESVIQDPYTPKGSVESTEKYLPGIEKELQEYTIPEPHTTSQHHYVPSDKNPNKKKILEYKPAKVSCKRELPAVTYQPTPKALVPCFSSDEDEPEPKKAKISTDLNVDDFGPEFDILDQILDEEKLDNNDIEVHSKKICTLTKKSEKKHKDENKTHRKSSEKHSTKKSSHKSVNKKSEKHDDKKSEKHSDKKSEKHDGNKAEKHDGNKSEKHDGYKTEKHDGYKTEKHDGNKSEKHDGSKTEKHDGNKSEKHDGSKTEKHDGNKSEKHDNKKIEKHDDKKTSRKHEEKKSSAKNHDKKVQEKIKSDKKHKLSSNSKSDPKSGESNQKRHKSSKEKSKNDKSDKEKHSDSKSTDKSTKSTKHSTSKSSDSHEKDHKSSSSNHSSKSSKKHKNSSSNHDSKHAKDYKSSSVNHDSKRKGNSERHKSSKKSREKHEKEKISSHNISDNDHYMSTDEIELDQNEESISDISESDEESRALECMKIFEEYVPTEKPVDNVDSSHNDANSENDLVPIPGKKRISHTVDKKVKVLPKAPLKPDYKVSAAQAMAERLAKVKEYHASKNLVAASNIIPPVSKSEPVKSSVNFSNPTSTKIRIAHVPYASTLVNAKKGITPTQKSKLEEPSTSFTTIQSVKKGVQRVAHIPNEKFIDRPGVLEPLASKIPANIRSTYLNMMIDECLKIYLSATDAYARAQHEELTTSKKCSTVQIYKNSAVLTVSRLRKEFQECNGIKKSGADCSAFQKICHLASSNTSNLGSWSIESKRMLNSSGEFSGAKFYNNIKKWVLTEEQLQENGFPRPHSSGEKGRAIIHGQNKQISPKGLIRTCCRCKKDYIVDKKGFPAIKEECIYHPNNKYRVRGEVKYQCCSQDSSSDGCCVAPCHVYEYVDFENLKGFIKTMPPDHKMDDYGVYSLDCEMCYTTHGLDLTRVTVINSECKVVYETLIKPLHPIIDYNTRYSGITEEQMANVKTTLLEVQATLLSMFNCESILIGHSLESDFKALKLIHDTVIDTSVLFPHKMGPPFKRALRNLSSEYLKKIIQNSVDGHDSAEDATVCMELLIYKLKEDLKTR